MFTTLAHLGHSYSNVNTGPLGDLDHCMPVIVGAGIIIVILFLIILYFMLNWQPKTKSAAKSKVNTAPVKKKTKK